MTATQAAVEPAGSEEAQGPRRDVASLADRLFPAMPSTGVRGWIGPIIVTIIGGFLRLWNLGQPHAIAFDETYYPKDALSLLRFGNEQTLLKSANDILLSSDAPWQTINVFGVGPEYVVHPPIGKWTIAVGIYFFDANPFGWRIVVALLGTLSILMVARIARRLTRSDVLGTMAGLLLALEGMHLVLSRTGLLDMTLMFWVLASFGLILIDRDRTRRKLADLVELDGLAATATPWGPRLGGRPLRWLAGITLGLACGVKWSGVWFLLAFAVMSVVWDVSARRAVGVERPWLATVFRDAPTAAISFVLPAVAVYVASWSGWILTSNGWGRDWADGQPPSLIPAWARSLWHYHAEQLKFHVGLASKHPYASNPLSWPFMARPTSFYVDTVTDHSRGCTVDKCTAEVLALGNPIIWWAAIFAMIHQLWRWIGRRDWRSGAVLVGIAAGWLPWLLYLNRTIFTFYTVVYSPFIVMALAMTLGTVMGPTTASRTRRRDGAIAVGVFLVLVVAVAWWFYPIWVGNLLPTPQWQLRMWMPTWV